MYSPDDNLDVLTFWDDNVIISMHIMWIPPSDAPVANSTNQD